MKLTLDLRHVELGDVRLNRRLVKIIGDIVSAPEASLPEACGDWAGAKASYRFFANPAVEPDAIRLASWRDAMESLPPDGPILAVQDTTSLDFTAHPATRGLGYMTPATRSGLFVHSTLAVAVDGVPCGLIDQRTWARDPAERGLRKKTKRRSRETSEKESQRWLDALDAAEAALPADRRVVTIADREADIYDLFARPRRPGSDLLIRVRPRRGVRHPRGLLGAAVLAGPVRATMTVELRRGDDRPPRTAVLALRYERLDVAPPVNRRGRASLPDVPLTAILAEEQAPPPGRAPVRWWLATTLPVDSPADARRMVRWYTLRWLIERFHFVLKSGCKVERLRLGTADRLGRATATYSAAAWRLLHLTYQARLHPDAPCTTVLSPEQAEVLRLAKPPRAAAAKAAAATATATAADAPLSLREAVRAIARLGGFLARKSDGDPGVQTLWRGLRRLDDMVAGHRMNHMNLYGEPVGNS